MLDTVILAALVDLARRLLLPTGATSPYLVGTLEAVLGVFVFAPMIIAAHRYSVAGMLTPRLTGSLAGPIFGRFVKTSLILSLITVAGYAGGAFLSEALDPPLGTAVFFMAFAATIALSVRLGPLFSRHLRECERRGLGRRLARYSRVRLADLLRARHMQPALHPSRPAARNRHARGGDSARRRADPDPLCAP